jgi:hypothetical protein
MINRSIGFIMAISLIMCIVASNSGSSLPDKANVSIISFKWVDMHSDKVGAENSSPDGRADDHFSLSLILPIFNKIEIKSISLYNALPDGKPAGGAVWSSSEKGAWLVGVFHNGKQINSNHVNSIGEYSGYTKLDLYINSAGIFSPNNYSLVKVTFGDGTEMQKLSRIGKINIF